MNIPIKLLGTVAITENVPEHNLYRGQVGTIVEMLAPETYEVEFSDNKGQTYAILAINTNQFMVLHVQFLQAA